jgi:hypothetical protein
MPNPKEYYTDPFLVNLWRDWYKPKVEDPKVQIEKLPPLGDSILRHLIEHYGAEVVAKAAQVFVEAEDKREVLRQAKEELERILGALKCEFTLFKNEEE